MRKALLFIILTILLMLTLISCSQKPEVADLKSQTRNNAVSVNENQSDSITNEISQNNETSRNNEINQKVLELYEKGLKLYYDRNFKAALDLFNQVLAIDPQNYQALNGKGATYAFQGRYAEGISLIQQSIQLKPDFVYARFNLGLAYELAGNYDESIKAYQEALKLDHKDVWSYYGIASIYGRKGEVEKVIEWLRPAIALEPEVKAVARDEKDFNPVKNDPRFQALIKAE